MRFSLVAGVTLVLALTAACGGTTPPGATGPARTATPTAAAACAGQAGAPVVVQDFSFGPQTVTVAVGGVVTWTNVGQTAHTVTFDGGPDCGRLAPGATVSRTMDTAGSFSYVCTIHPAMKGTVAVQ